MTSDGRHQGSGPGDQGCLRDQAEALDGPDPWGLIPDASVYRRDRLFSRSMALLIFRPASPTLLRTVPPTWFSSPRALRLALPLTRPTTSWARPFAFWPTP